MTNIPQDLLQTIHDANGGPVRMVDPSTQQVYVVLPEESYQRLSSLLDDSNDPEAYYPLLAELSPEDWEDRSVYGLPPIPDAP